MKKICNKKTAVILFFALLLVLAVIVAVKVVGLSLQTEEPPWYIGFTSDRGGIRYYDDGGRFLQGWQTIGGNTYYFKPGSGYMVTGVVTVEGEVHAFREDGTHITTGFVTARGGKVLYCSDGKPVTGWQVIDGKRYYFYLETGYMATGTVSIGGKIYAFDEDGVQIRFGFVSDGTGTRYFSEYVPVTGWQEIYGNRYYFYIETGYMATGTVRIGGEEYNFSADGVLQSAK